MNIMNNAYICCKKDYLNLVHCNIFPFPGPGYGGNKHTNKKINDSTQHDDNNQDSDDNNQDSDDNGQDSDDDTGDTNKIIQLEYNRLLVVQQILNRATGFALKESFKQNSKERKHIKNKNKNKIIKYEVKNIIERLLLTLANNAVENNDSDKVFGDKKYDDIFFKTFKEDFLYKFDFISPEMLDEHIMDIQGIIEDFLLKS